MEIIPKLNIDKDIEFLETGSLCHASNIIVNDNNDGVSNEHSITKLLEFEDNEKVVGYIACSDEFIIFTSNNKIIRYNERTKTSEEVKTNWIWEGGKVFGTYTYNVNNELIIAITEISDNEKRKIPLKVINLNKPYFKENTNDNKYTLAPNVPKFNLVNHELVSGGKIIKGVYNIFIRFKLGTDYTNWFSIGYPINIYNRVFEVIERNVAGFVTKSVRDYEDGAHTISYEMGEYINDKSDFVNKQIKLNIDINNNINEYEYFQIGYSVSTPKGSTEVFTTIDYDINTSSVILDNYNKDNISFDELTRNVFNIYNVKTLCNYNNRLYLANYKEENLNKDVENIDISGIKVIAKEYNKGKLEEVTKIRSISSSKFNVVKNSNKIIKHPLRFDLGKAYIVETTIKLMVEGQYHIAKVKFLANRLCNDKHNDMLYIDGSTLLYCFYKQTNINSYSCGIRANNKNVAGPYNLDLGIYIYNDNYIPTFVYSREEIERITIEDNWNIIHTVNYCNSTNVFAGNKTNGIIADEKLTTVVPDNLININEFIKIDEIYEINSRPDIYTTYHPWWFYQGIATINNNKYIGGNNRLEDNNTATFKIYNAESKAIINYSERKFHNSVIFDKFDLINDLKTKYPKSTFKVIEYYETNTGKTTTEIDKLNKIGFNKHYICYDGILNKYCLNEGLYLHNANIFDKIIIINEHGEETIKTIQEIYPDINVVFNKQDYTNQQVLDYFEGNDVENKFIIKWNEDVPPTDLDYKLNNIYDVSLIKRKGLDDSNNYIIKTYDNNVKAVGYKNIKTTTSDDVTTISADKSYCIVIPLIRIINKIKTTFPFEIKDNEVILLNYKESTGETTTKEDNINNLYLLINANDFVNIDDTNVVDVNICKINKNCRIDDDIVIFDKYYSLSTINLTYEEYPKIIGENSTGRPTLNNVSFYINKIANKTEGEKLDTDIVEDEINEVKTAINYAVYNFFIHYVYPNGNYTDGIQIQNNRTFNKQIEIGQGTNDNEILTINVNEDTTIDDIKYETISFEALHGKIKENYTDGRKRNRVYDLFGIITNVRYCNIFPEFTDGVALYKNNNGDKLFIADPGNISSQEKARIKEVRYIFKNITIPDKFVGFFISYEKSEPIMVGEGLLLPNNADLNTTDNINTNVYRFYYPDFDIVKQQQGGNILWTNHYYIGGVVKNQITFSEHYEVTQNSIDSKIAKTNYYGIINSNILTPGGTDNGGREGVVKLTLNETIESSPIINQQYAYYKSGILLNITDNIYLSKNKILTSLGYIQYKEPGVNNYNYGDKDYNYNYDYYKSTEYTYVFNKTGIVYDEINPQSKTVGGSDLYDNWVVYNNFITRNRRVPLARIARTNYSLYNLRAKTFNNIPTKRVYTFNYDNNKFVSNETTIHIYPLYINDMFKITDNYIDYAKKIIINFNKEVYSNFIEYYGQTIRRSDIINDENIENNWRIFRPEEYKIIAEYKGNIINLIGIGVYLIAHCEHSMFVFNRNNTMQTKDKDVQLIIPDAFEIDYSEVFTSQRGYAGIQKYNQWCVSNYGYVFYDNDSKKLYRYDNNNLDEISIDFNNLFKKDIENINFVIDEENTRLICIGNIKDIFKADKFAISYNFNTKSWISSHSYWYKDCFNTKFNCYFINDDYLNSIDTFDKNNFNNYSGLINDDSSLFKIELDKNDKPYSFIDVVFNNNVDDKVLDYITYSVTKNNNDIYSGDKLLIYTNCCNTGYVDISKPRKSIKDYKSPVFKFGVWVFNWFMNKVLNINTNNPINRGDGKFNLDVPLDNRKWSDNKLVVGKYFVVRFIFRDEENKVNVNNIQCY